MYALTYIEIDVDFCSLTYGSAPCTAAIPTTGSKKCYNTTYTCQDRTNFTNSPVTLRFSMHGRAYEPASIEALPCVVGVEHSPGAISLGENLGERASVTVTFRDFRHSDTGPGGDKNLVSRAFDPFSQGTYFGRFRTRHRYLRGKPLRVIRGELGQAIGDMETRHYVVESFSGPDVDGNFSVVAKDVLKLADNDRAQAPVASSGRLNADITSGATSLVLTPTGIGNAEYPASGYVALSGKEVVAFTRSSDTLTITRAQFNTTAIAHKAADRVQLVLRYAAEDVADIIADLLENYAGIDASFIPLSSWQTETAAFIGTLYTANIVEPTGVRALVSELIEQAALALWWDDEAQLIRLQVLRAVPATAGTFDEENTQSMAVREQPEKRLTQVWTFFNQRDPCEKLDQENNFQSIAAVIDAQRETDYGSAGIKKIYSRWIPNGGRATALRVGDTQLARYKDPPRLFEFSLFRGANDAALGGGYKVGSWALQDDEGEAELVPVQVTRLKRDDASLAVTAEEILFDYVDSGGGGGGDDRVIILDTSQNNVNLQTLHDSLYTPITTVGAITLTLIIDVGVIIGSASTGSPALDIGTFTSGLPITVNVRGRVQGAGGNGGAAHVSIPSAGGAGGVALYTRQAVDLVLDEGDGEIWGGGGGGGGSRSTSPGVLPGGGGGAGTIPGAGGYGIPSNSPNGTATAGGVAPGAGGDGGGPGLSGQTGTGSGAAAGGAAGSAIDGISYVTVVGGAGDRRGAEIN